LPVDVELLADVMEDLLVSTGGFDLGVDHSRGEPRFAEVFGLVGKGGFEQLLELVEPRFPLVSGHWPGIEHEVTPELVEGVGAARPRGIMGHKKVRILG
jgi:hypothetical protein